MRMSAENRRSASTEDSGPFASTPPAININRKVIADLAVNDMEAFKALVEKAKAAC